MLSTRTIKAVVFELDGTLVDTQTGIQLAAEEMLADLDLPHDNAANVIDWMGDGFQKLIHRILSRQFDGKAPDFLFRVASASFLKAYQKRFDVTCTLYPEVETCLQHLSSHKILKAVLTNQSTSQANETLNKFGIRGYFDLVLGQDALEGPKPSPAGLYEAAFQLRLKPEELMMVGGSVNDVNAARSAGCPVACVSYGYNYGVDIRKASPDVILASLADLSVLIDKSHVQTKEVPLFLNSNTRANA